MTTNFKESIKVAMKLSHYGIDSFNTIINKITKLIEEAGLSLEEASSMLEEHYRNFKVFCENTN